MLRQFACCFCRIWVPGKDSFGEIQNRFFLLCRGVGLTYSLDVRYSYIVVYTWPYIREQIIEELEVDWPVRFRTTTP